MTIAWSRVRLVGMVLAVALVGLVPAPASALPTASFTFSPASPVVGEKVTFDFTGSCDEPPCRIQWRWFQDGGSSLGTAMGEGEEIQYAFPATGSYSVVVKVTNALPTHGSATATHAVAVSEPAPPDPVVLDDRERIVTFDGWTGRESPLASAGGYRVGHGTAVLHATRGRMTYVALTGPGLGRAVIRVDGVVVRRVDLRSASPGHRAWTFRVPSGERRTHRVVLGPAGGRPISLDGFLLRRKGATGRIDDTSARIAYGGWTGRWAADATGGTVRAASTAGATAQVAFTGSSLTWVTARGPDQGRARVEVDGVAVATVDNWSAVAAPAVAQTFDGLAEGPHAATVVVLPPSRAHPAARTVAVDAFLVR